MKALLLFLHLLLSTVAFSSINLDGVLDEKQWESAQEFTKMVEVEPFTLEQPKHKTQTLIFTDETGIYVGVKNYQPLDSRNNNVSARDRGIGSDKIELMLDFDNNAITAYSFQVGISGSIRDGLYSSESGFSNEWDGNWQGASASFDDYWSVEVHIPWDVVSMKASDNGVRKLNWYMIRTIQNKRKAYANVSTTENRQRFLNDFAKIEVKDYTQSSLQLFGYATGRRDFHNAKSSADAGLDLFWKSGTGKQLTATINPDFGQIESDGLVVNFSATETFFNERRPFFTENQSLFNVVGTFGLRILHTRRIGSRPDVGSDLATGIDAAVKYTDNRDNFTYGVFAASESSGDGYRGRDYFAGRFLHKTDKQTLGFTSTFVDRPDRNRTAFVNAFNHEYLWGKNITQKTLIVASSINETYINNTGWGGSTSLEQQINENQAHFLILAHYGKDFEVNDFGFLPRNDFNAAFYHHALTNTKYSETSALQQRVYNMNFEYRGNDSGNTLGTTTSFRDDWQFKNASSFNWDIQLYSKGVNDLISRGNGLVNDDFGYRLGLGFRSNNANKFRYHGSVRYTDKFSVGKEFSTHIHPSYYFQDNYSLSWSINYRQANDWLNWQESTLFGRYKRDLFNTTLDFNANFSAKQELRLRLQWLAIDAQATSQYQLDAQGSLQATNNEIDDFSLSNTALQIRYRYEFAPLSNLYVVYSRGASVFDEVSESVFGSFNQGFQNVNSDNFLIKFRYKFF